MRLNFIFYISIAIATNAAAFGEAPRVTSPSLELVGVYYESLPSISNDSLNSISSKMNELLPGKLKIFSTGMVYMIEVKRGSNVFSDMVVINSEKISSVEFTRSGTVMEVRLKDGDLVLGRVDKNTVLLFFCATVFPTKEVERILSVKN
jgi:hypothetical protein